MNPIAPPRVEANFSAKPWFWAAGGGDDVGDSYGLEEEEEYGLLCASLLDCEFEVTLGSGSADGSVEMASSLLVFSDCRGDVDDGGEVDVLDIDDGGGGGGGEPKKTFGSFPSTSSA